jgi:hypothetical protein
VIAGARGAAGAGMLRPVIVATSAAGVDAALIGIFVIFFQVLVIGLIAYAVIQALGERRENNELRNRRQDASRG